MRGQLSGVGEGFVTLCTAIGRLPSVGVFVIAQERRIHVSFSTNVTNKLFGRFLAQVHAVYVFLQDMFVTENFLAHFTFRDG